MSHTGHGLILGKFLPPHAGHQHLIHFAQNFVERLTVLVCTLKREPIDGHLRYGWMQELFPRATLVHITEDLPQEPADHPEFWAIWRKVVLDAAHGSIDYVFASEDYGYRLAQEVGAQFIPVDARRAQVPVSGTAIRTRPLEHWSFLPECVRPYFVKRICIFGPESTGKSTLARQLAEHFQTVHVAEFARELLDKKQGICDIGDIPTIARGQAAAEEALARRANRLLFCDTDLLTTTIWSEVLFGHCPAWIHHEARRRQYDLYLLLDVDVPWVDDQQRYLPHARNAFFQKCREALERHQRPYLLIQGNWHERWEKAVQAVRSFLESC